MSGCRIMGMGTEFTIKFIEEAELETEFSRGKTDFFMWIYD